MKDLDEDMFVFIAVFGLFSELHFLLFLILGSYSYFCAFPPSC